MDARCELSHTVANSIRWIGASIRPKVRVSPKMVPHLRKRNNFFAVTFGTFEKEALLPLPSTKQTLEQGRSIPQLTLSGP